MRLTHTDRRLLEQLGLVAALYFILGLALASCAPARGPLASVPDAPATHTFVVEVHGRGERLEQAFGTLTPDSFPVVPCLNDGGRLICALNSQTGGATVQIDADGYRGVNFRIELPIGDYTWPSVIDLRPSVAPLARLKADGRRLITEEGRPFIWRGASAFRLVDYVADGNETAAIAFLDWMQARGFTVARVFSSLCQSWFDLCPADGQRALPRVLDLAQQRRIYLEVVAVTGSGGPGLATHDAVVAHVGAIGLICAHHPACGAVEVANEVSHSSQADWLPDALPQLVALIPPGVPVSSGSSCCGEPDEPPYLDHLALGSYLTPHTDRSRETWDRTRHLRELEALSAQTGKYVVDDEGIGAGEADSGSRSTNPHEFFARGVLSRLFGFGATWHCSACLHSTIPSQTEAIAADAFIAGTRIVPDDVTLQFENASWATSPVKTFQFGDFGEPNTAIRAYSGVNGDTGILVLLGITGNPSIEWQHGWRAGAVLAERPGVRVLEIQR